MNAKNLRAGSYSWEFGAAVLAASISAFPIDQFEPLVGSALPHLRQEDILDAALSAAGSNYCHIVDKVCL